MGQKTTEHNDEVNLLLNLCRHHERTIAEMFNAQEPILRYARAMRFIEEKPYEVRWLDFPHIDILDIEECIEDYEKYTGEQYKPDWSDE